MRKYTKGKKITTIEQFDKTKVIYFRDKVLTEAFYKSWQYRYILLNIQRGFLYEAVLKENLGKE